MDYIQVRSGVHYYRRRLPRDVAKMVGRNEVVRSLNTIQGQTTFDKARVIDLAVQKAVAVLRDVPALNDETARTLFRQLVNQGTQSKQPAKSPSTFAKLAVQPAQPLTAEPATMDLVGRLSALLGLQLEPAVHAHVLMSGSPSSNKAGPFCSVPHQAVSAASLSLAKATDLFLIEHGRAISPKTRVEYDQTFRLTKDYWGGDVPVASISKASARDLKALLLKLPANMVQRFPGKTLQQSIEHAAKRQLPSITGKTINKKLSNLSAFFRWLNNQGYVEDNPFRGLAVREVSSRRLRDPFTPEQLRDLFSGGVFELGHQARQTGASWRDLENFWIPLVALFTGMRLGEIAQLSVQDIRQVQDGWVIEVHDRGTNHLKTLASNRLVPVHQDLIKLGLLHYRSDVEQEGKARLFPELEKAADGYESSAFSKRFAGYLYRCGVKTDRRLTFHSFRHTFKDLMREAGIDRSVQDAICGHDDGSVQAGYGRGYSATALAKEMARISLPVQLTHLAPK